MLYERLVENAEYEKIFTKKTCEYILNSCLAKCGDMVDSRIIKGLKIKAIKLRCEEKQTFIKMKSPKDGHIWYRWRRGAKAKYIEKINESIEDEILGWTHIAYIKFVRMLGTDLRVPIVVGKSNSSSSFDLVYTTKSSKEKENSKSWLQENFDWEWDVENLVVLIPSVRIVGEKDISKEQKLVLYRKIAYEIERYLFKQLCEVNTSIGPKKVFMS